MFISIQLCRAFANEVVFEIADQVDRMKNMMNKHEKKAYNIVHGIREHGNYLFYINLFIWLACLVSGNLIK